MPIAHLGVNPNGFCRYRLNPVDPFDPAFSGESVLFMTDDQSVAFGVQAQHVIGFTCRAIDTASLADSIKV